MIRKIWSAVPGCAMASPSGPGDVWLVLAILDRVTDGDPSSLVRSDPAVRHGRTGAGPFLIAT
jgi:hypothetical protein